MLRIVLSDIHVEQRVNDRAPWRMSRYVRSLRLMPRTVDRIDPRLGQTTHPVLTLLVDFLYDTSGTVLLIKISIPCPSGRA